MDDPFAGVSEDTETRLLAFCCGGWVGCGEGGVFVGECVAVAQCALVAFAIVDVWGELGCCEGGSEEAEEERCCWVHIDGLTW